MLDVHVNICINSKAEKKDHGTVAESRGQIYYYYYMY